MYRRRTPHHHGRETPLLSPGGMLPRAFIVLSATLALGACDYFPTEPPRFQPRFILPGESTTLRVAELLPSGVAEAGSNFQLSLSPTAIPTRTLGEICGAPCVAVHGQRVPKPAFVDTFHVTLAMPADVASATLAAGGAVAVAITHNFGFDPLRPPGGANGRLMLQVLSGTNVIGNITVTDPFPSGTTLQRTVPLAPGPVSGDLTVRVIIESPAGGTAEANWVTVNTSASLSGTVTPGQILVSEAGVRVQNKTVSVTDFTIDMSGVDQSLRGRVQRGALIIDVDNPFNVSGTMVLRMIGGTGEIITPRTIQVQPGRTQQRVELSRDDLSLILQSNVTIRVSGSVSGQDGTVTVRPGQVITIDTHFDLTIEIG
jgi:propanediol utilization protein